MPNTPPPPKSAIVLTRYAVQAFEKHDLTRAMQFSTEALAGAAAGRLLPDPDAGLAELILAKCEVFRGQHQDAIAGYERAVSRFQKSGDGMQTVLSISLAEMALLYTELGDNRTAQNYMDQSAETATSAQSWQPEEKTYLADLRVHFLCITGKLSEARKLLRDTLEQFQLNSHVSGHTLGHMYRDYAQISFASGDKATAIAYLNRSLSALQPDRDNARDLMFTRTMLAEYQSSQHDDKDAETSYQIALEKARGFSQTFPRETARVYSSWGTYLLERGRWHEARDAVRQAVALTDKVQVDDAVKADYLRLLAKIDRHVHEKHEAAEAEQRAKDEAASAKMHMPSDGFTVDVLSLRAQN